MSEPASSAPKYYFADANVDAAGDSLEGSWVQVLVGGASGFMAARSMEVGIVEAVEDAYVLLRKPDAELTYLPLPSIRTIHVIERPLPVGADRLLRASAAPDEAGRLLRPSPMGVRGEPAALLRAHADDDTSDTA